MLDLRRIEYVTSHYQEIQGLRIAPFGLWLIGISALAMAGYVPARSPQAGAAILLGCLLSGLVVLVAYRAIGTRYERDYGVVRPLREPKPRALSGCLSGAGYLFILYVAVMLGSRHVAAEVSLLLAGLLLVAAWRSRWYRKDYLALAAVLLGVYALPFGPAAMASNGMVVIVGGLLDHFLLIDTLAHTPEDEHARSV